MQQNVQERFYSSTVFLHLCYKSIFYELGQMLPHPTHDSTKSSPNVRLSCPTEHCSYRCSQLVFFSPCETLDQPVYRVTCCSPESTPDAGIFFFGGHQNYPNNFFISFCKQLTPQPTTVSHFLRKWTSSLKNCWRSNVRSLRCCESGDSLERASALSIKSCHSR